MHELIPSLTNYCTEAGHHILVISQDFLKSHVCPQNDIRYIMCLIDFYAVSCNFNLNEEYGKYEKCLQEIESHPILHYYSETNPRPV